MATKLIKTIAGNPVPRKNMFTLMLEEEGIEVEREYKFYPVRLWRFDYAIPKLKIAIECDGGVWNYGRHVRPTGYIKDMKKFNAAAELGWLVLKYTPEQLNSSYSIIEIKKVMNYRTELLDSGNKF
jgi:very-short-patch-repair endonuclease